jgi:hypothetical protein
MENNVLLRIISATVFIATIAISYICFSDTYFSNVYLITSSLLLALSLSLVFFGVACARQEKSDAGLLSTIGVQGFFGFLMSIASALALFAAGLGGYIISGVLDALALVFLVLTLTFGKLTRQTVNKITEHIEFKSFHLGWYDQLRFMAETTSDSASKALVAELAERSRYLARDLDADGLPINNSISSAIGQLELKLANSSSTDVHADISAIDKLFRRRELDISSMRRKS